MKKSRIASLLGAGLLALAFVAPANAADKTERLWSSKCASCHGEDCKAQTAKGKEMKTRDCSTADWNKQFSDAQIKEKIENGVTGERDGVKKQMDGYKDKLKPDQIDALVKFMRSLQK